MPDNRIGVTVRAGTLYLSAVDVVALLRDRATAYRTRAAGLVDAAADPNTTVEALDRDVVTTLDESLACIMVAEELDQRADELDAIG